MMEFDLFASMVVLCVGFSVFIGYGETPSPSGRLGNIASSDFFSLLFCIVVLLSKVYQSAIEEIPICCFA